ncbi:ISAs1 family transposase [Vibrio alginolyticus]|nr:ISAs1 family transposase [Vibrio alginolyticus]
MLDINGTLVTIDVMACQTNIAKAIVEQGGDYLLSVKSNQGKLRQAVEKAFSSQRANVADDLTIEQGHGRLESRQCYVLDSTKLEGNFFRWKGLNSIVMVENFRLEKGKSVELEYRYYISSKQLSADQAAKAVREHWA